MAKTIDALLLMKKLLKKGGELYLEVPNLYWQAYNIVLDPSNRQFVKYAYGGQHNDFDYHFNGFTPNVLDEDLKAAGFEIKSLMPNSSIECWVTKP